MALQNSPERLTLHIMKVSEGYENTKLRVLQDVPVHIY